MLAPLWSRWKKLELIGIFGKSKSSRIVFFQFTPSSLLPSIPCLFDSKARLRFLYRIYPLLHSVFFVYRRICRIQRETRTSFSFYISCFEAEIFSSQHAREIELAISEILQATVENRLEILSSSSLIFKIFVTWRNIEAFFIFCLEFINAQCAKILIWFFYLKFLKLLLMLEIDISTDKCVIRVIWRIMFLLGLPTIIFLLPCNEIIRILPRRNYIRLKTI